MDQLWLNWRLSAPRARCVPRSSCVSCAPGVPRASGVRQLPGFVLKLQRMNIKNKHHTVARNEGARKKRRRADQLPCSSKCQFALICRPFAAEPVLRRSPLSVIISPCGFALPNKANRCSSPFVASEVTPIIINPLRRGPPNQPVSPDACLTVHPEVFQAVDASDGFPTGFLPWHAHFSARFLLPMDSASLTAIKLSDGTIKPIQGQSSQTKANQGLLEKCNSRLDIKPSPSNLLPLPWWLNIFIEEIHASFLNKPRCRITIKKECERWIKLDKELKQKRPHKDLNKEIHHVLSGPRELGVRFPSLLARWRLCSIAFNSDATRRHCGEIQPQQAAMPAQNVALFNAYLRLVAAYNAFQQLCDEILRLEPRQDDSIPHCRKSESDDAIDQVRIGNVRLLGGECEVFIGGQNRIRICLDKVDLVIGGKAQINARVTINSE